MGELLHHLTAQCRGLACDGKRFLEFESFPVNSNQILLHTHLPSLKKILVALRY